MSFLFSEMVKYSLQQVNQCDQLEARLHEMGTRIGVRLLELFFNREKSVRRLTRLLPLLTFLSQVCWRSLFGHPAELLRGQDHENECTLYVFFFLNNNAIDS
jgi:trafficking protein particle complex subunit 5